MCACVCVCKSSLTYQVLFLILFLLSALSSSVLVAAGDASAPPLHLPLGTTGAAQPRVVSELSINSLEMEIDSEEKGEI